MRNRYCDIITVPCGRARECKTKIVAVLAILAGLALAIGLIWQGLGLSGTPEDREMRSLVARLARATDERITFADMILWTVPADQSVCDEIVSKGRKAVPYLIEGLHDSNEKVRDWSANLLIEIPTRQGLESLINCMVTEGGCNPGASHLDRVLVLLTGYGEPNGRRAVSPEGRKHWLDWWEANKDKIVETEAGLGIRNPDGTITMLGKNKPAR